MMNNASFLEKTGQEWLTGILRDFVVEVKFTKKDGTERVMQCTLQESSIPETSKPKGSNRAVSEESLRVFDTEKNEWRSFRWDSIKSVKFGV
jgi:hypothetical protein